MISSRQSSVKVGIPPLTQRTQARFRRSDAVGAAGLVMLLCGAWFIFAGQYPPPLWIRWLVGPTLWYVGGATTVIWVLWRIFGPRVDQ